MAKTVGLTFPNASAEKKYACPVCGKKYSTEEALNKHIKEKHPDAAEPSGGIGTEE